MKRYNSKIGFGIVLFIVVVMGMVTILMVLTKAWPGIIPIVIVSAFIFYVFRTTYYIVDNDQLIIKSGFIVNKIIPIERVFKIVETNNPLSSPANSLDRLAIYYNQKDWIMISPQKKEDFIRHMTTLNGMIIVLRKK